MIYELFLICLAGDVEPFQAVYMQLKKHHPALDFIQPAAVLAALKRHTDILQFSLEHGAMFDDDMNSAIQSSGYTPSGMVLPNYQWDIPFLELLWRHNWKQIKTSPTALQNLAEPRFNIDVLTWFFDHGVKLGRYFVRRLRDEPAEKVKFLIDRLGIDAFKGSGVINEAAMRGQTQVLKVLLDAGICIVDEPPVTDEREPGPYNALFEAVRNKHLDTAAFLLDRGSPIEPSTVNAAKRQGGDVADLIECYTAEEGASGRQIHMCTQEICDPHGIRIRGLGQGYSKSSSFGYLFGN